MNSSLDLRYDELLSTVLVAIIDKKEQSCELLAIGDGVVSIDGILTEYEQDNKPDYIGYHLKADFETWYNSQTQKMSVSRFQDISMATDGIWTFRAFDTLEPKEVSDSEICSLFFNDREGAENEKMLFKKLIKVEKEYRLKPTDDLTIIRIML